MPRPLNRAFTHWTDLLLGGENSAIPWTDHLQTRALGFCLLTIALGVGAYGFSIGLWNGPRILIPLLLPAITSALYFLRAPVDWPRLKSIF